MTVLRLAATQIRRHPQGFGRALSALEFHLASTKEIVVIGEKGNELERAVFESYLPNTVVLSSEDPETDGLSLLADKAMIDGKATAYVCENFECQRPVTTVEALKDLIAML